MDDPTKKLEDLDFKEMMNVFWAKFGKAAAAWFVIDYTRQHFLTRIGRGWN